MNRVTTLVLMTAALTIAGCGRASKSETPSNGAGEQPAPAKADEPATRPADASDALPAGWDLVPEAHYAATQRGGEVVITATGENPTAGYQTRLFQSPMEIFPPQFLLARKPPDGLVAQVITPFQATASFKAGQPVERVTVIDAAGRHAVAVEPAR